MTDLALLRSYADMLLLRHRVRRSAFHVPASERLEQILGVLTEVDPDNQRMHRARLAEVCWDRGQDVRARKLFDEAMNADEKRYGPIDFKKDAGVLTRMMSRLVDADLRAGRVQAALEMVPTKSIPPQAP